MHIRKDDTVLVLSGDDRGTRAKVLRVIPKRAKLIVEGVNRVYKHMRRSQRNPQGGRLSKEMPIPASNVMLVCDTCGKATRVEMKFRDDGSKERRYKKCGAGNGLVAPPHKGHAKK